jgi:hypothetical protein
MTMEDNNGQQDNQGENKETTTPTETTGDKLQNLNPLERGDMLVKRLEEERVKAEELLKKQQELYATQKLSGTTLAGAEVEKKEETPQEYKDRVMSGKL